ncbi:MAG: hypothetical protein JW965_06045 [Bacteroidales bacterium]|nr:hypothetical protein [Bacteroidales bacterium]
MIINRQNYQIWITDYYDGQLDDFQTDVLMDFLGRNPDIMSEFEDYAELVLRPDDKAAYNNAGLLRSPEELTNEQVEHYAIAHSENDLSEKQKQEITELKKTDPRFREYINIYEKIRLRPENITYPYKLSLLKIPDRRRHIRIVVNSMSVAASVAIITGLFFIFNPKGKEPVNDYLAEDTRILTESGQKNDEKVPLLDLTDELPRHIAPKTQLNITVPVRTTEIITAEPHDVPQRALIQIPPLAAKGNIRLDKSQTQYLLAEIEPYQVSLPDDILNETDMSVREFLAYQFRKQILHNEDPDIDNLKAWEIADAGIKGANLLLGWNMELDAIKNEEGRLENISFTSELIKFDHRLKKNDQGL